MKRFSDAWQRTVRSRLALVAALTSAVLVGLALMAGLGHASIGSTSASASQYQYGFPTTKAQCKHGGWKNFPQFKNQGRCVSYVASGGKSYHADPPGHGHNGQHDQGEGKGKHD